MEKMIWSKIWNGSKELPFWAFSIRAVLLYIALIIATRFRRQRKIAIHAGHNYLDSRSYALYREQVFTS